LYIHYQTMSSIFLFENEQEADGKINIDELYEKNLRRDLKQLEIFNKILNRIHKRINVTARNKVHDKHIWFLVPTFLFGEPAYNAPDCIAYVVNKLVDNGFHVKYIHPSTLFISWDHWIPSYVRNEIKHKTGKRIDELGRIIVTEEEKEEAEENRKNHVHFKDAKDGKDGKKYKSTSDYKPTGKFIYDPDIVEKLQQRL